MDPENDTNVTTTPDEPGNNDVGTEGAQTAGATNSGTQPEKTFTQKELDDIIKARLAEKERTLKSRFEKDLDTKIAAAREAAQADLDKLVEERANARLIEKELKETRTALMAEYELTEDQAARLQGETSDDLKKDAEKIFGALKGQQQRKPPVIKTGESNGVQPVLTDLSKMTPAQIRENLDPRWKLGRH